MVESAVNKINKLHFLPGTGSCVNETLLQEVGLLINGAIQGLGGLILARIYAEIGLGELVGLGL